MKVLFLTLYPPSAASPRYRVHQFLPGLAEAELDCTVACAVGSRFWNAWRQGAYAHGGAWRYHLHELLRRRAQLRKLDGFDRIVVQKCVTSASMRGLLGPLLERHDELIYDIDDAVHRFPPDHLPRPLRRFESRETQGITLMRSAKLTLAGNRWLEAEARAAGGHPVRMPTVVDTARFSPTPQPDSEYRLGWMGSPSTAPHLDSIAEVLTRTRDTSILAVGAGKASLSFPCERADWSLETERELLSRFSVGLMPLPRDVWTQGKCGLKALLCMAMGRPVIATPFGAACDLIEHGVDGLLAGTPTQWQEAIARLRDPSERARMGQAAREKIEREFALAKWAPLLAAHLRELS